MLQRHEAAKRNIKFCSFVDWTIKLTFNQVPWGSIFWIKIGTSDCET